MFFVLLKDHQKQRLLAGNEEGNEGRESDDEDGGGNRESGVAVDAAAGEEEAASDTRRCIVPSTSLGVVAVCLAHESVTFVGSGFATLLAVGEGSLVDAGAKFQRIGAGSWKGGKSKRRIFIFLFLFCLFMIIIIFDNKKKSSI